MQKLSKEEIMVNKNQRGMNIEVLELLIQLRGGGESVVFDLKQF
jgi:hypothetical protein